MHDLAAIEARLSQHATLERDGFFEEVSFVPSGDGSLYAVCFRPSAPTGEAIVICPAFLEHATLQPTELELLERAARVGIGGVYVQPAGVGESTGDARQTTMGDRAVAASTASDLAVKRLDSRRVTFLGARSGGIVAASAAGVHPGSGLVLWDPAFETAGYFRQVRRVTRISSVAGGAMRMRDPFEDLRDGTRATILGNPVDPDQLLGFERAMEGWNELTLDGPVLAVVMTDAAAESVRKRLSPITQDAVVTSLAKRDATGLGMSVKEAPEAVAPTIEWLSRTAG